jgi:hypothetical protein
MEFINDNRNETESLVTAARDGSITSAPDDKANIGIWNKG